MRTVNAKPFLFTRCVLVTVGLNLKLKTICRPIAIKGFRSFDGCLSIGRVVFERYYTLTTSIAIVIERLDFIALFVIDVVAFNHKLSTRTSLEIRNNANRVLGRVIYDAVLIFAAIRKVYCTVRYYFFDRVFVFSRRIERNETECNATIEFAVNRHWALSAIRHWRAWGNRSQFEMEDVVAKVFLSIKLLGHL